MTLYLVIGIIGLVLLVIFLLAGEVIDGIFDGLGGDLFSGAAVAGFLSAFGFCAALAESMDASAPVTVAVGAVAGLGVGGFAAWLTRALKRSATDDTPRTKDVIGYDGVVVSGISATGFGVVNVSIGGHLTRLNARSTEPLDIGTMVTVVGVLSPTAVSVARL